MASLLPDSPARFFGQPLTDISMLQVYQEHHDLEYEILSKAKSEQELREIIYINNIYTYNVSTMLNVRKVSDRLYMNQLRPYLPPPTFYAHIVSGLAFKVTVLKNSVYKFPCHISTSSVIFCCCFNITLISW